MTITVQAMYENGVLKPRQPLPLKEKEEVQVTLEIIGRSRVDASYGLIGWKGDAETVERIALDPTDEI
ncbi:MAG TPA: antitoxin family protein [Pirellulales bacterium]|nr:antitoxin family protein [Pirellulales bacterium]